MRGHRFWGPAISFLLDDVDLKRPKYELVRFFSPLALFAIAATGFVFARGAASVFIVIVGVGVVLLGGALIHISEFGLGRLAWLPWTAFALSLICGLVSLFWEPAGTWRAIAYLAFIVSLLLGYLVAGIRLAALAFGKGPTAE